MKTFILFSALISFFLVNGQDRKDFVIQGNIKGLRDSTMIYLIHYPHDNEDTVASTVSRSGKFKFTGTVHPAPDFYRILIDNEKKSIPILLDNSTILLDANIMDEWSDQRIFVIHFSGSKVNNEFISFSKGQYPLIEFRETLRARRLEHSSDRKIVAIYNDSMLTANNKIRDYWRNWISSNPNSRYAPFLIRGLYQDADQKDSAYNVLSQVAKASNYGVLVKDDIARQRLQAKIKIGNMAQDFTSTTPEGQSLSLKDVIQKGKLTLIDFWASWCVPCREETPNLRKTYQAFHDKGFNIISVSFDAKEKSWKDAIKKDSMVWFQVSQLRFRNEDAGLMYGIDGIPASILIDSDGRIIAIDADGAKIPSGGGSLRGDSLYQKVNQILGEPKKNNDSSSIN